MMNIDAFDRLMMVFRNLKYHSTEDDHEYSNSTTDGNTSISIYKFLCDNSICIDLLSHDIHTELNDVDENNIWVNDTKDRVFIKSSNGTLILPIEVIDQLV